MKLTPLRLLLLLAALALVAAVQIGAMTIAFERLGLAPATAALLLLVSVLGSLVNLPLGFVAAAQPTLIERLGDAQWWMFGITGDEPPGRTLIAVNVGGCLVPLAIAAYLLARPGMPWITAGGIIAAVALLSYLFSRPVAGIGITLPLLLAPASAALLANALEPEHRAALAYVGGTLGVLIGADLLRIREVSRIGTAVASIGGAGSFDGVFLSGLLAVLLA